MVRRLSGTDVLVEMGVRTGLILIFTLLRQNWALSRHLSATVGTAGGTVAGGGICNDILQTALDVIRGMPPQSLADTDGKLPPLAKASLSEVVTFLKVLYEADH